MFSSALHEHYWRSPVTRDESATLAKYQILHLCNYTSLHTCTVFTCVPQVVSRCFALHRINRTFHARQRYSHLREGISRDCCSHGLCRPALGLAYRRLVSFDDLVSKLLWSAVWQSASLPTVLRLAAYTACTPNPKSVQSIQQHSPKCKNGFMSPWTVTCPPGHSLVSVD